MPSGIPSVCINGVQADTDAVMVSGDVVLSVLYSGSDEYEPVAQVADRIPFSRRNRGPPGVQPDDTVCLDISPEEGTVLPEDNEQGERRVLACDISLCCTACVSRKKEASKRLPPLTAPLTKPNAAFQMRSCPALNVLCAGKAYAYCWTRRRAHSRLHGYAPLTPMCRR